MKNKIAKLFAFLSMLYIIGCKDLPVGNDFLEKPPSVSVTIDTIFSKLEFAQRYLFSGYANLYYGIRTDLGARNMINSCLLECLTDLDNSYLNWTGGPNIYYSGVYDGSIENAQAISSKYPFYKVHIWQSIRIGYNFLKNIDRVPDADENTRKTMKAEARMIIANTYTDLYRHYGGGLPWLGRAVDVSEELKFPRLTSLATLDSIIGLIDKAMPDLPWTIADASNWDGRFTQAAAMGLKARLLLFAASPVLNSDAPYLDGDAAQKKMSWHGKYDANLWKRAADAAKALIDKAEATGNYKLVKTGNPRVDFRNAYTQRNNGEVLISTRVEFRCATNLPWGMISQIWQQGTSSPNYNYVEMFPMANGLAITDPGSGYLATNPYANRDPRLYETILTNGDAFQGRTAELWIGGRERLTAAAAKGVSGHQLRKFILDQNTATSMGAITQWPSLRLAEIYLSYAEAINEFNNGPTAEAYRCVNLVRSRVNLGNLPANMTKEQFREALLVERACEFGFEEVRWFDLVRWKREADFKKPLYKMDIVKTGNNFTYTKVEITPKRYWANNWSPKWYFSAFPPDEVNKGYGLVQNPGW